MTATFNSLYRRQALGLKRIAILLLQLACATGIRAAGVDNLPHVRNINNVVCDFRLVTQTLSGREPVTIAARLRNIGDKTVEFRYINSLGATTFIYDSKMRRLAFRAGASPGEYPAVTITLKPGEQRDAVLSGEMKDLYDLPAGKYYLRLTYDLRLVKDTSVRNRLMHNYHSRDIVVWDTRYYDFHVL